MTKAQHTNQNRVQSGAPQTQSQIPTPALQTLNNAVAAAISTYAKTGQPSDQTYVGGLVLPLFLTPMHHEGVVVDPPTEVPVPSIDPASDAFADSPTYSYSRLEIFSSGDNTVFANSRMQAVITVIVEAQDESSWAAIPVPQSDLNTLELIENSTGKPLSSHYFISQVGNEYAHIIGTDERAALPPDVNGPTPAEQRASSGAAQPAPRAALSTAVTFYVATDTISSVDIAARIRRADGHYYTSASFIGANEEQLGYSYVRLRSVSSLWHDVNDLKYEPLNISSAARQGQDSILICYWGINSLSNRFKNIVRTAGYRAYTYTNRDNGHSTVRQAHQMSSEPEYWFNIDYRDDSFIIGTREWWTKHPQSSPPNLAGSAEIDAYDIYGNKSSYRMTHKDWDMNYIKLTNI